MKEVLLFSGGPDSLIGWDYLNRQPDALYIKHNCNYEIKQLEAVSDIKRYLPTHDAKKIKVTESTFDLSVFEKLDAEIPLRNMYFAMIAANMGYTKIYMVIQRGEQSIPDRSHDFARRLSHELSMQMDRKIEVIFMFDELTKQDMVKWYMKTIGDEVLLKKTVSCFHPTDTHCGACPACFRRWIAFEYNNIHETHTNDITEWPGITYYEEKIINGKYEPKRTQQTMEVLRRFKLV